MKKYKNNAYKKNSGTNNTSNRKNQISVAINLIASIVSDIFFIGVFSVVIYLILSKAGAGEILSMAGVIVFASMSARRPILIRWPIVLLKKLFGR